MDPIFIPILRDIFIPNGLFLETNVFIVSGFNCFIVLLNGNYFQNVYIFYT